MTALKLTNLSNFFGDVQVIQDINLEGEEGELVGPSGCGKSTFP